MPKQTIGRIGLFMIALLSAAAIGAGLAGWREPTPHSGMLLATPQGDPLQYGWDDPADPYATIVSVSHDVVGVSFPEWVLATREAARYATRRAIATDEPSIRILPTPTSRYPTPLSEADALDWFTSSLSEDRGFLMQDPIARRISAAQLLEHFGGLGDLAPTDLVWLLAAKLENPDASYPGPSRVMITAVGVHTGAEVFGLLTKTEDETVQSYAAIEALTNE